MKKMKIAHVYKVQLQIDILETFSEQREEALVLLLDQVNSIRAVEIVFELGDLYFEVDPEDDTEEFWKEVESVLAGFKLV